MGASPHDTSTCADDTAVAVTPVGVAGGTGGGAWVVALTTVDGAELPLLLVATTR